MGIGTCQFTCGIGWLICDLKWLFTSGSADGDLLLHYLLNFPWRSRSCLVPFILPHCFVGPSSSVLHYCSGLCFEKRLLIARTINCLFVALNLGEGWMFLMVELLVGCR